MKPKPSYRVLVVSTASDGGGPVLGTDGGPSPAYRDFEPTRGESRRLLVIASFGAAAVIVVAAIALAAVTGTLSGDDADDDPPAGLGQAIAATESESESEPKSESGSESTAQDRDDALDLFVTGTIGTDDEDANADNETDAAATENPSASSTTTADDSSAPSEAAGDSPTGDANPDQTSTTADGSTTAPSNADPDPAAGGTPTTDATSTTETTEATQPPTTVAATTTAPPTTLETTTTDGGDANGGNTCASNGEFERVYRNDFNGSSVGSEWTLYNSPGNAGFGLRRPSAITVSDGKLVITAQMQDGSLVSGGMALGRDLTYGKYVFRVRTDNDPSQAVSGVVLTWPQAGNNHRNGENNMYETLTKTPNRNPFFSFIHKPFGNASTQEFYRHDADGAQFQVMSMEWTPDRITITRQGPGSTSSDSWTVNETSADLIPDVPHHLAIQLDGWKDTIGGTVRMEVDYVEVYKYCG